VGEMVRDSIDEQDAIQMIHFMLNHLRQQAIGSQGLQSSIS
jgi:hypothetical protein